MLTHVNIITWMNFNDIILSEINQIQKEKSMIPHSWGILKSQIH